MALIIFHSSGILLIEGQEKTSSPFPNEESRQSTPPDISHPRNAGVSYINAGEEDQMVWLL